MNEKLEAYANRLHDLALQMNDAMSQGHDHTIRVNPEMVDDIRAAEALVRVRLIEGPV